MKKGYFDRSISDAIKGVALIFMFVHHFFAFPEWYISGVSLSHLAPVTVLLRWPLKICVSVFAFLTGYFFFLGRNKSYRHSLRKIRDTLVSYWMVYLPFLALALALGCYCQGWTEMLQEAFGLGSEVMIFCWYVYFYCAVMLLLPLVDRLSTGTLWADALLLELLPLVAFAALRELFPNSIIDSLATSLLEWYPCVLTGFLFAKYDLFETLLEPVGRNFSSRWGKGLLWLSLACCVCLSKALLPRLRVVQASFHGYWLDVTVNMDVLYAPIFLYGLKNLLELVKWPRLLSLLGKIGRESLLMWFLHCLFFNCCSAYTQPLLYWPRLAVLVLPWGLALCYAGARLLHFPLDWLLGRKKQKISA